MDEIQVYPNPFADQVHFQIEDLQGGDDFTLRIFDINGRLVFMDRQGSLSNYTWKGYNSNGQYIAEGLYFYSIESGEKNFRGKILKSGL
jgi:flagellar hook assembly protein FlgD